MLARRVARDADAAAAEVGFAPARVTAVSLMYAMLARGAVRDANAAAAGVVLGWAA